ncbi:RNA polymerase sigma factor [Nocardiopsis lambiniae]|uniref:RNA polymerase sigma factor n=1 Tax=Nocardiopsis lambiniae TaxID=3075539 RepID=A0ABU2MDJ2_9ACTN|nr:sigma-70 family RNA polymerase sigma factor [Nocardiopsis sp. DSM 44743]MDT0330682.1 sigma-70 family RNA polymerase sigma factor [Nocardiopsis sp. DSM 44743]
MSTSTVTASTFATPSDELDRLAAEARTGSPDALEDLVRGTRDDVARHIARRVPADRVEELVQETYLRALRALPGFGGRCPVRAWLLTIARNTVADRYRHDSARPRWAGEAVFEGIAPDRFDEHLALRSLIEELPAERRRAFLLTRVEGLSYAEAARALGVPIGTVRSRVARARADLRRDLSV